jgi:hypothetical protein
MTQFSLSRFADKALDVTVKDGDSAALPLIKSKIRTSKAIASNHYTSTTIKSITMKLQFSYGKLLALAVLFGAVHNTNADTQVSCDSMYQHES